MALQFPTAATARALSALVLLTVAACSETGDSSTDGGTPGAGSYDSATPIPVVDASTYIPSFPTPTPTPVGVVDAGKPVVQVDASVLPPVVDASAPKPDAGPGLPGLGDGGITLPNLGGDGGLDLGGLFGGGNPPPTPDAGKPNKCQNAICIDVFDCYLFHPDLGDCGFTACDFGTCK